MKAGQEKEALKALIVELIRISGTDMPDYFYTVSSSLLDVGNSSTFGTLSPPVIDELLDPVIKEGIVHRARIGSHPHQYCWMGYRIDTGDVTKAQEYIDKCSID